MFLLMAICLSVVSNWTLKQVWTRLRANESFIRSFVQRGSSEGTSHWVCVCQCVIHSLFIWCLSFFFFSSAIVFFFFTSIRLYAFLLILSYLSFRFLFHYFAVFSRTDVIRFRVFLILSLSSFTTTFFFLLSHFFLFTLSTFILLISNVLRYYLHLVLFCFSVGHLYNSFSLFSTYFFTAFRWQLFSVLFHMCVVLCLLLTRWRADSRQNPVLVGRWVMPCAAEMLTDWHKWSTDGPHVSLAYLCSRFLNRAKAQQEPPLISLPHQVTRGAWGVR